MSFDQASLTNSISHGKVCDSVSGSLRAGSCRGLLFLGAVMIVGTAARFVTWSNVFSAEGIRFIGNDAYYHLLRIQRIVAGYPHVPWRDSGMNYPAGAEIPWPPLYDFSIATTAWLFGGGAPSALEVEQVAVLAPVLIGVLTLPLFWWVSHQLVEGPVARRATFVLAVLPAHILFSCVGRTDQHVAELFFLLWMVLGFILSWRAPPRRGYSIFAPTFLGVGIAGAFWSWPGSALHLLLLLGFSALWYLLSPPSNGAVKRIFRSLLSGSLVGAVLLILSLLLFAPSGTLSEMRLESLTGFHVVLVLLVATFGATLLFLHSRGPEVGNRTKLLHLVLAGALPLGLAVLVLPGFSEAIANGLIALGRGNDWYRNIQEFDPLFFAGWVSPLDEFRTAMQWFGPTLFLFPFVLYVFYQQANRKEWRVETGFLLFWGAVFFLLALGRQRFILYLCAPLSIFTGWLWFELEKRFRRRLGEGRFSRPLVSIAFGVLLLFPFFGGYLEALEPADPAEEDLVQTLSWLEGRPDLHPKRKAVFADWSYGHQIAYIAHKPVLVNPFGTALGEFAMRDSAAFFLAPSPEAAAEVLKRREIGFLLLDNPITEAYYAAAFAPPEALRPVQVRRKYPYGHEVSTDPEFWELVVSRLYFFDGLQMEKGNGEALGNYRLVYESESSETWRGLTRQRYKIFEVVDGASVQISTRSMARVVAELVLRTNRGRIVKWESRTEADAEGRATLVLPYATGLNGAVLASRYRMSSGSNTIEIALDREQVEGGSVLKLRLE